MLHPANLFKLGDVFGSFWRFSYKWKKNLTSPLAVSFLVSPRRNLLPNWPQTASFPAQLRVRVVTLAQRFVVQVHRHPPVSHCFPPISHLTTTNVSLFLCISHRRQTAFKPQFPALSIPPKKRRRSVSRSKRWAAAAEREPRESFFSSSLSRHTHSCPRKPRLSSRSSKPRLDASAPGACLL